MKRTAHVRVYFNRHTTDELVWIVAFVHQHRTAFEIAVREISIEGANLVTKYERPIGGEATGPRRHDGPPAAYQEGFALVEITDDGRAILEYCNPAQFASA